MNGIIQTGSNILRSPGARRLGHAVLATVVAVHTVRLMDKMSSKFSDWRASKKTEGPAAAAPAQATTSAPESESAQPTTVARDAVEAVMSNYSYNDLRKKAAELNINTNGWKKEQIAEAIVAHAA